MALINIHRYFILAIPNLLVNSGQKLPSAAKTNVRVRIRRRIIQIQREHTCIRAIIPIATA